MIALQDDAFFGLLIRDAHLVADLFACISSLHIDSDGNSVTHNLADIDNMVKHIVVNWVGITCGIHALLHFLLLSQFTYNTKKVVDDHKGYDMSCLKGKQISIYVYMVLCLSCSFTLR